MSILKLNIQIYVILNNENIGSSTAHSRENATTNFYRPSDFRSYYK